MVESDSLNFLSFASKFSLNFLFPSPLPIWKRRSFSLVSIHCHLDFSNSPLFPLLPHNGDTSLPGLCFQGVELHRLGQNRAESTDKSLKPSIRFPTHQMETDSVYLA